MRHDDIPSRLVENLYWFGRYTVRCEDKARLLRGTIAARIDEAVWKAAVKFCRELGLCAIDADPTASLRDDRNPRGSLRMSGAWRGAHRRCADACPRATGVPSTTCSDGCRNQSAAREEPRAALDQLLLSLAALAGFCVRRHDAG